MLIYLFNVFTNRINKIYDHINDNICPGLSLLYNIIHLIQTELVYEDTSISKS